ncbi:peptidase inhibitor family I36 protein [Streptomyces sp. PTD5-9]|uniref:peptidase inhibitor family I36 protein n=1 Tax=Streptomyces sp. PTD5-9 TaxID=3120150 RepID=UPI003FCE21F2
MARVSTFGTAAAMGAVTAAALLSPAAAAAAYECGDGHVCLYAGHTGRGAAFSAHGAVSDLRAVQAATGRTGPRTGGSAERTRSHHSLCCATPGYVQICGLFSVLRCTTSDAAR